MSHAAENEEYEHGLGFSLFVQLYLSAQNGLLIQTIRLARYQQPEKRVEYIEEIQTTVYYTLKLTVVHLIR